MWRKPRVQVLMEVWQSEGQLSKRVRLEIMLLSLKCSLISMEQLNSKFWEVPAVLTIPLGMWRTWKGRNQPDFAGWAGHLSVCRPKQQQRENRTCRSKIGCEWDWDRGKVSFWDLGILANCTGMMPPTAKAETGEMPGHGQAAWPPLLCCLSLAPRLGMCAVSTEFLCCVSCVGRAGIWLHCFPWICPECLWRVKLVPSVLTCNHFCQTIQNTFESGTAWQECRVSHKAKL